MSNYSPITPPPELVQKWWDNVPGTFTSLVDETELATQAAQWGADQELEACCADVHSVWGKGKAEWLRSMRRPKPPSLKEQALELAKPAGTDGAYVTFGPEELALIRRALEALPND